MKHQPVDVERAFLRSMTVTVSAASLVLAQAEDVWFPAALTPFVAVLSYVLVDRRKRIRLPVWTANALGVIAFVAMAWEFSGNTLLGKLLSGAHLLVYITWVVLMLQKGIRQLWWLMALSILQLAVASVLTTTGVFGVSLVGMLLLMLWTLSVFTLYRGRIRVAQSFGRLEDSLNAEDSLAATVINNSPLTIRNGLQVDSHEPWIGWRFRAIVTFAFFASLVVAGITFVVFPRVWMPGSPLAGMAAPRREALVSQTGFTENVQLGEIGQIMQTEGRVLQFEITRMKTGAPVTPEAFADAMRMDEILFRGNALGYYHEGRWSTGRHRARTGGDLSTDRRFVRDRKKSDIRIRITQDPPTRTFAFAPAPAQNAVCLSARRRILQRRMSSSLTFADTRPQKRAIHAEPVRFDIWCRAASPRQHFHSPHAVAAGSDLLTEVLGYFRKPGRNEIVQQNYAYNWCLNQNIETDLPQLFRLANEVCTQDNEVVSQRESINRIFRYLSSSGRFQYSLNNTVQDSLIDPVEDFLINRRTGHCEYFASAGALMMQAVGVPARIVNGYKGYETNSVSGRLEVKQKHAHAWVEAYIDGHWETLDPTPAAAREEAVSQISQLAWWQDLTQTFNDLWQEAVQSMSPQRQEAMVQPWIESIKKKVNEIRQQGVWELLKEFWTEIVMHPEIWFSPTTGVVTFAVLLFVGLIIQRNPHAWLRLKFRQWLRPGAMHQHSVVRFYENFRDVCRKNGLPLPDHQTAHENARMAQRHFAAVLSNDVDAALPSRIAIAFNQVRFGQTVLSADNIAALRTDVVRLGDLLNTK